MPSNSKKNKKKSKSKNSNSSKKSNTISQEIHAAVFDESEDYPTSRVIKRAPNGDVIVESMSTNDKANKKKKNDKKDEATVAGGVSRMANVLDLHWESLSANEKKEILRIDKNDVFNIIQKYQSDHSCNCSVCGKRHMTMDQEMERIYNMLYEIDKIKDPDINPIKFHLSIIKDLQISKNQDNNSNHSDTDLAISPHVPNAIPKSLIDQDHEDEDLKEFLSSNNANTLKEEVLHFKQAKQLEHKEHKSKLNNNNTTQNDHTQHLPSPLPEEQLQRNRTKQLQRQHHQRLEQSNPESSYIEDKLLKGKYLQFTQKYISSHPKIAEEYVKRVMMYPEMRHVTDQLMSSDGDGFLKAIENFVIERARDEDGNIDEGYYQKLGDVRSFTTMLHKGQPLTQQEYSDLQRNIAERMTGSYDTKRKEFREISPLEKELFARFMFGEDREQFGEMVMQSFREKFDHEFGGASVSASLAAAAAAATLTNPLNGLNNHYNVDEDKDEYDDSYEYSDYDEDEDEDNSDFLSEYTDEDEDDLSDYGEETDSEHECSDPTHHHTGNQIFTHNREHIDTDDRDHFYHEDDSHHVSHDEDYESEVDEATRLEEGRKLIQIAITKLLQARILESYHTKQADVNRLKLLQELEDEKEKKKAKEEKKQRKKEKEKERKKLQQQAKEEERRRKIEEEERLKKESEQREKERREAQRKKVEEAKKKKDEERRRRLEEQKKREEQQEKQRKLKEEIKKKKEEERKEKERAQREKEEAEERKNKEKKEEEQRIANEKKAKELQEQAQKHLQDNLTLQNNENEFIKQALSSVNNSPNAKANSGLYNGIQVSPVGSESLLGNASGRNLNASSSNNDILSMLGTPPLVPPPPGFSTSSLLASNAPAQSPASQPVSSSVASNFLPSSLWGNINASQPNGPIFNTSSSQNSSLMSSLNNPGFNSVQQPLTTSSQSQPQQDNSIPKSLSDELSSLTSMLHSTNINDPAYPSNNTFGASSLWGDSHLAGNTNNSASLFSASTPMRQSPHVSNPLSFTDHSLHHRKSIWNDNLPPVNSVGVSTTPSSMPLPLNSSGFPLGSMDGNTNNKNSSFVANNGIWNTGFSNTPPLSSNSMGLGSNAGLGVATQHSQHPLPQSTSSSHGAAAVTMNTHDHVIFDLICKSYATVIQTQPTNHSYVPIDTLYHQFNTSMQMDYHTFINKLLEMRILHGCEILNSSVGAISHVKIPLDAMPQKTHNLDHAMVEQGNLQKTSGQPQMVINAVESNSS